MDYTPYPGYPFYYSDGLSLTPGFLSATVSNRGSGNQSSVSVSVTPPRPEEPKYNYLVRLINPVKKSEYVTRTWHGVCNAFDSPAAIRQKLRESFPEKVPSSGNFHVGYIEKRCNAKRWLEEPADLSSMYKTYNRGDTITIWCDGKHDDTDSASGSKSKKRKSSDSETSATTRRDAHENDVDKVFHQLRSIHKDKYTGPQYRVWSRMIANKIHDSVDEPPNIPIITGETPGAKRKKTDSSAISDALIGAATAVSKYLSDGRPELQNQSTPSKSSGARDSPRTALGISPASKAKLTDQYLSQLQRLQGLLDNSVLTPEEFAEQKSYTLTNLRTLNKQPL